MKLQYRIGKLELDNMELEQSRIVHDSAMRGKDLTIQKLQLQVFRYLARCGFINMRFTYNAHIYDYRSPINNSKTIVISYSYETLHRTIAPQHKSLSAGIRWRSTCAVQAVMLAR